MSTQVPQGFVGEAAAHDSADLHVSGEALYIDDLQEPGNLLFAAPGMSDRSHARITAIDLSRVERAPGVVAVITAADIPGRNDYGPIVQDDPIFAENRVEYDGQCIFAVIGETAEAARRAVRMAVIQFEDLEPVVDIDHAVADGTLLEPSATLETGDWRRGMGQGTHVLEGHFRSGSQEHFYMEPQIALAIPGEDEQMHLHSSTQNPSEVQRVVARALDRRDHDVVVTCRRMGGGFGGKETQASLIACIAAIAARHLGRAVKVRLTRREDMRLTGKRHDYRMDYRVGFDGDGSITGIDLGFASRCGNSSDLSGPVNDRLLFHADNAYYLENARIVAHKFKTHTVSNTAFRGFGGPQGMLAIEYVMDDIARYLGMDPVDVRRLNFYGLHDRNITPYGMSVHDNVIPSLVDELEASSRYRERRTAIDAFNRENNVLKRGLALTPVKFGISFTNPTLNQGGALVNVYRDGSVLLNHGGTEMGQGLYTKVAQVVATVFQIPLSSVRCSAADTSKVPNSSATAASASSDLNGAAAARAAEAIRDRLCGFAASHYAVAASDVRFSNAQVVIGDRVIPFARLVNQAYESRISLSATGFYRTPKIGYDLNTMRGRPFLYFCYGAAVSEVIVDTLTGESRVLRVDILHDVGKSWNPAIDRGQIEGGFMQGLGWLTSEEVVWRDDGILLTDSASTYKIPTASDWPDEFNVEMLSWSENREQTVHRSKAVGEPPLMLALSAFFAIKDAIGSLCRTGRLVELDAPATPEKTLKAIQQVKARELSAPMAAHFEGG